MSGPQRIPPAVRASVLYRDGYRCIAPAIDGQAGWCRNVWGDIITRWPNTDLGPVYIQMSHEAPLGEGMMGKKATPVASHLVALCPFHHTGTQAGSNWEANNRNRIRRYLEQVNSPVHTHFPRPR